METFVEQATRKQEIERLKSALDYIALLANIRDPHLGHPRTTDKTCIFCMAYFALHNGAYGDSISNDEYKALAKEKRDSFKSKP